jgi:uncharacterized membrane protein YeiH
MIYLLDLFGVAVFAISGSLAAGRKRMDLFGVCVLGFVTAVGGGTLRDLLLGVRPVFWITDPTYVYVVVAAAGVTFIGAGLHKPSSRLLPVADAIGLAMFCVIGADKALHMGVQPVIAVIMGIMTGVAGGMIRDVLTGEVPLILRREIYATAALCGAAAFVLLSGVSEDRTVNTFAAAALALALRLAAIRWELSLPVLFLSDEPRHDDAQKK